MSCLPMSRKRAHVYGKKCLPSSTYTILTCTKDAGYSSKVHDGNPMVLIGKTVYGIAYNAL